MITNMLPRICRACGKEFIGGPRAWYCPECRKVRAKEARRRCRQSTKSSNHVPLGGTIKCAICGKDIIKTGGLKKYCSECAPKHLKEVDNQQSLAWKKENPEKIKQGKRELSKRKHQAEGKQSGVKYISWDKSHKKWVVKPYVDGRQIDLGRYKDLETAKKALSDYNIK